jgi:hypothetical protein
VYLQVVVGDTADGRSGIRSDSGKVEHQVPGFGDRWADNDTRVQPGRRRVAERWLAMVSAESIEIPAELG